MQKKPNFNGLKKTFLEEIAQRNLPIKELFRYADAQKYCVLYDERDKQVHYWLSTRENSFFIELQIDNHRHQRDNLIQELVSLFDNRDYHYFAWGHGKWSHIWQTRRALTSEDNLRKDFWDIYQKVSSLLDNREESTRLNIQQFGSVKIGTIRLVDLLKEDLVIPNYQRGYCWRKNNIISLLEDIHCSTSDEYYIGSIVLKEKDGKYEIIDGQQRLITLAIFQYLKQKENSDCEDIAPILRNSLGTNNQTKDTFQHLKWAVNTIRLSESVHPNKEQFENISADVIEIAKDVAPGLEFKFFTSLNSEGKRLGDYDLLKTHHLRYIKKYSTAEIVAKHWHQLEKFNGLSPLLYKILYRLRCWRLKEYAFLNADTSPEHYIFHHYSVQIEPIKEDKGVVRPLRFDSMISGGLGFFTFLEHYEKIYFEFEKLEYIQRLEADFAWGSHRTLMEGIRALAFLYYAKFGEFYLQDALYCIANRVSELRNRYCVYQNYLSADPIFQELTSVIDRANTDGECLAWIWGPSFNYTETRHGNTADWYWSTLNTFTGALNTILVKNDAKEEEPLSENEGKTGEEK